MPRRIVERLQRRLLRSSFYFCSIRVCVTYTIHTVIRFPQDAAAAKGLFSSKMSRPRIFGEGDRGYGAGQDLGDRKYRTENQKGGRGERKKKTQGTISPSAHHK